MGRIARFDAAARRLDERTGAARAGRIFSWLAGYWSLVLGVLLFGLAVVEAAFGHGSPALICLAFGVLDIGIGLFIGPKGMVRRLFKIGAGRRS